MRRPHEKGTAPKHSQNTRRLSASSGDFTPTEHMTCATDPAPRVLCACLVVYTSTRPRKRGPSSCVRSCLTFRTRSRVVRELSHHVSSMDNNIRPLERCSHDQLCEDRGLQFRTKRRPRQPIRASVLCHGQLLSRSRLLLAQPLVGALQLGYKRRLGRALTLAGL
jgi:hypothetical protein